MGKYRAKKTTIDGITFDSKMEAEYYILLKEQKQKGEIRDFTMQPPFELMESFIKVDGRVICKSDPDFAKIKKQTKAKNIIGIKYIADFEVFHDNDTSTVIDVKGRETADFKLKRKMFEHKYPDKSLKLVTRDRKGLWHDYDEYRKLKRS